MSTVIASLCPAFTWRRRRPDEVLPRHKRRANTLWVVLIVAIIACEWGIEGRLTVMVKASASEIRLATPRCILADQTKNAGSIHVDLAVILVTCSWHSIFCLRAACLPPSVRQEGSPGFDLFRLRRQTPRCVQ